MKKTSLLLLFLSFSIISFAAKTYNILITVTDYQSNKLISDAKVSTYINGKFTYHGETDNDGQLVIKGLETKTLEIIVEANKTIYALKRVFISNPKRKDLREEIKIQYTLEEEQRLYQIIDDQYKDETLGYASNMGNDDVDTTGLVSAEFPGGRAEMMKFLSRTMKYPEIAIMEGIEGKVYLSFFIQKDGVITDVKLMKGAHPLLDEEAIRTIRNSPKWIPATRDGKPVKSVFHLPLNFRLN